jgi:hypothetical protein
MGLFHTFEGNTTYVSARNWGKAEPLARNPDPTAANSCFLTGDRICDTMAEYKVKDTSAIACQTTSLPCVQTGPICDSTEPIFDENGDCRTMTLPAPYGSRTYDHTAPTLPVANRMSYRRNADAFTYQQFLVMYSTAKWRGRMGHDVLNDEKHIIRAPTNLQNGFWNELPNGRHFLRLL